MFDAFQQYRLFERQIRKLCNFQKINWSQIKYFFLQKLNMRLKSIQNWLIKYKVKKIKIKRFDKMKSQNGDTKLDETSVSIDHSTVKNCPQANPATHVCCNKSCDRIAYICDNKSCKCYKQHSTCPHLSIQSIMNTIQGKIIPFNHFQQSILNIIDKTIDELSSLKEKLQGQIKQNFALYGLTTKDKNLYNAFNQQNITGKQITQLFLQTICMENTFAQKEPLDKKFEQLWKSVDTQIKSKSSEFLKLLESIDGKELKVDNLELFKNSKITMNEEDKQNLLKMFGDKIPKSAKLIYQASENNFKQDKFHEKCDNIPHTLTLCETVHGKVIGGYTSLLWNCKSGKNLKDESGSSFIFSLTNNHKFTLDKSKDATRPHAALGPAFGSDGPDFFITRSANTNNSYTLINKSYFNQNYKAEDGESYMKFNGNPAKKQIYLSKEWQVWQLEFNP